MRISDWSSDVCSSDLPILGPTLAAQRRADAIGAKPQQGQAVGLVKAQAGLHVGHLVEIADDRALDHILIAGRRQAARRRFGGAVRVVVRQVAVAFAQHRLMLPRSEEHTSELQSLMRISYA